MQYILSRTRRAAEDYNMIKNGDRICVGVSGGKDSTLLFKALLDMRRFYPERYEVVGVHLDMGAPGFDFSQVAGYFSACGAELRVVKTNIYEIIFEARKEKNPCSLCANMRRGALHNAALQLGCNKIALGHHFDDVAETFLMSLLYEGRISCFSPVTYLSRADLTMIRPFIYLPETEIKKAVRTHSLPVAHNPCPADGNTKREFAKQLLCTLSFEQRDIKQKIIGALQRSNISGWGL